MSRIRLVPILVIMLVAMSVLFGGWEIYRNFGLVAPLEEQLKADKAVTAVETVVNGQEREVKVTMKKVADLQTAYEGVEKVVYNAMGPYVKIDVLDTRDNSTELQAVYRSMQPTLFAGIANGDFPMMIRQAQTDAKAAGIDSQITMNDAYIFVQLEKGDHYLYEALPYKSETALGQLKGVSSL